MKPILFDANAYHSFSSHKLKWSIVVCVVCYIATDIILWMYTVSINLFYIINCLLKHNLYRFIFYKIKLGKFIFCFGAKLVPTIRMLLFFDLPTFVVWVLLTIIYIIYHFIFQSFYLKPIIFASTEYHSFSINK